MKIIIVLLTVLIVLTHEHNVPESLQSKNKDRDFADCHPNEHINAILEYGPSETVPDWTVTCHYRGKPGNAPSWAPLCVNWWCYSDDSNDFGVISTQLIGNGRGRLDYGICSGSFSSRKVKVYLNGIEISSVVGGSVLVTSKVVEFDYTDSDTLEIEESSSAVFQFNSFEVIGCSSNDDDAKFSFDGTLQKTKEVYEYPSSIKVRWFNFLEGDDSDTPWVHCDGKSSVSPITWSNGNFGFEMEESMDSFDESIKTDPTRIPFWAKYLRRPAEEIANVKFAMGFVTGQYENDIECVFGNDLGFRPDIGPNGEVAFADRYAVFYKNGELHCGPDSGDRRRTCSSESWWFKIPQGFSCGLGVDIPGSIFDGFVTVDCSEVVVKVAKAISCRRNPDLGDDCFNFVNWT